MENNEFNSFTCFRLITENERYVAVRNENLKVIDKALKMYGSFEKVPVEKTVRGIFLKNDVNVQASLARASQENDITINQLRPR